MSDTKHEIHDRLYKFALSVLQLVKFVPKTTENLILIRQVIRSSSSIGANALEADGSESKKNLFIGLRFLKRKLKKLFIGYH